MVSKNVGSYDRTMRAVAGGGLAIAELGGILGNFENYIHYFAIIMAVWLVGTGASGNCPTYTLMGLSTCPHISEEENTNQD